MNSDAEAKAFGAEEEFDVVVVGGGPAGLRAAEVAAQRGAKVAVFDAKPSVGRKFLVAGRGGLNLTHGEASSAFLERYRSGGDSASVQGRETRRRWEALLATFGPTALREWSAQLGVETFQASTGRVYPLGMKAAPLLRRWVAHLRTMGVEFRMRHRLRDLDARGAPCLVFQSEIPLPDALGETSKQEIEAGVLADQRPGTPMFVKVNAGAVVLALGGASWPDTGSDGKWVDMLKAKGVSVSPLLPANCGWECLWPAGMLAKCEGTPLKNVLVCAGTLRARGELMVTRYGLEGGALYALSHALRESDAPAVTLDFKPDSSVESLVRRLGTARSNFLAEAQQRWRLGQTAFDLLSALLPEDAFLSAKATALAVKNLRIALCRPRPIEEAISSSGGVLFSGLDENLMLRDMPGFFAAGEMLDWEAPTGGYLMQGCFASGTQAGTGAADWSLGKDA